MAGTLAPPPLQTPMVYLSTALGTVPGAMTREFYNWFLPLIQRVQTGAIGVNAVTIEAQTAAISNATAVLTANGVYRISWWLRVTAAAGVSSSLTVSVGYIQGGLTLSQSGAAVTGNTTSTVQSGSFVLRSDPGSPITFSVAYASVPAAAMAYQIDLIAEQLE